jgi:hypothetical protein
VRVILRRYSPDARRANVPVYFTRGAVRPDPAGRASSRCERYSCGERNKTAIRSNAIPSRASAKTRRAISTHSRPSPGAEKTATCSSSAVRAMRRGYSFTSKSPIVHVIQSSIAHYPFPFLITPAAGMMPRLAPSGRRRRGTDDRIRRVSSRLSYHRGLHGHVPLGGFGPAS